MKTVSTFLFVIFISTLAQSQSIFPVRENGLWGFINDTGSVVVEPQYDAISPRVTLIRMVNYNYFLVEKDNFLGLINHQGDEILPAIFKEELGLLSVDPLTFSMKKKGGIIAVDNKGTVLMNEVYEDIKVIHKAYFAVKKGGKWGINRRNGEEILPAKYLGFDILPTIKKIDNFVFWGDKDGKKKGVVNQNGQVILKPLYSRIRVLNQAIIIAFKGEKKAELFDMAGQSLGIKCEDAFPMFYDIIRIRNSHLHYRLYQCKKKKWLTPPKTFNFFSNLGWAFFTAKKTGSNGVIDTLGNTIIDFKYKSISIYNPKNKIFQIQSGGSWGLAQYNKGVIVEPKYLRIQAIEADSFALILDHNKQVGILNHLGEIVVEAKYSRIQKENGLYRAYKNRAVDEYRSTSVGKLELVRALKNVFTIRAGYSNSSSPSPNFSRSFSNNNNVRWSRFVRKDQSNRNNLAINIKERSINQGKEKYKGLIDATTKEVILPHRYRSIIRKHGTSISFLMNKVTTEEVRFEEICPTVLDYQLSIFDERTRKFIHPEIVCIRYQDYDKSNYAAFVRNDGTFGLLSKNGEILKDKTGEELQATFIDIYVNNWARIYQDGQLKSREWNNYAINTLGNWKGILSPFHIENSSDNNISSCIYELEKGHWTYIDTSGQRMNGLKFVAAKSFYDHLAIAETEEGMGVIDEQKKIIYPFEYANISLENYFDKEFFSLIKKNTQPVYLDNSGIVIPELTIYTRVEAFHDGLALVKKGKLFGFINEKYEEVIPCNFIYARSFHKGYAAVFKKKQWHFIDTLGQVIVSVNENVREVGDMNSGMAWFKIGDKYGYASLDDPLAIYPKFASASDFQNDAATVDYKGKYGIINKDGEFVFKPTLKKLKPFNEFGVAAYKKNDSPHWGLISTNGDFIIDPKYAFIGKFQSGFAKVRRGYFYGVINAKGEEIIPLKHKEIGFLSEGLMRIRSNYTKWQYYNMKNEIAISGKFDEAEDFKNGTAVVVNGKARNKVKSVINKKGDIIHTSTNEKKIVFYSEGIRGIKRTIINKEDDKKIITQVYMDSSDNVIGESFDKIEPFEDGIAIVKPRKRGWGTMNRFGLYQMDTKYQKIVRMNDNLLKAIVTGQRGLGDLKGNILIPPKYDELEYINRNYMYKLTKNDRIGYYKLGDKPAWIWEIKEE